ncbi:fumarylacetoacetate hydrolase family protein [Nonomuraea sp. FMUSA5-5]|uniref:Fumarylacetoacetate hydrolase family protein n=1 Tax=Nonomuraea composti TaxID=2720023 RepID=A0ABX1BI93_9ACTN|nr:fumarylacetoacetate hydrolase family protein [Nonomuraea sp. FMUSA5-5]NJP94803.1 fumarylacetoacetate hydrolase family protein [Nonomuraea sp. FMUSA5-5]
MRLLTIDAGADGHAGALLGTGDVLDLAATASGPITRRVPPSVRGILEGGEETLGLLKKIVATIEADDTEQERLREAGALTPYAVTPLRAVVPDPALVLSTGMNYRTHLQEMRNVAPPQLPYAFIKVRETLTGHGHPIVLPRRFPYMVDWEGELTVVIGRTCHDVPEDEAMAYVAGYTLANDVSARDWAGEFYAATGKVDVLQGWGRAINGKLFPTFLPCGPVLTTADEIADPHDLRLTTTVNGTVMQSASTGEMIFSIARLVSYFSQWYRLRPGDMITTGTPAGAGYARDPQIFLRPGDVVTVGVEGIGELRNPVVAAGARGQVGA